MIHTLSSIDSDFGVRLLFNELGLSTIASAYIPMYKVTRKFDLKSQTLAILYYCKCRGIVVIKVRGKIIGEYSVPVGDSIPRSFSASAIENESNPMVFHLIKQIICFQLKNHHC
jgi:hypothetical protein